VYQLEQAAGGKGRWWHVFKIQDGELVSLNVIDDVPIEKEPRVENIPSFRLQPSEMPADASLPFRISFDLTGTGITLNSEAADLVFKFPADERQVIVLRAVRQGENRYAADLPVALEKEEYIVDLYPAGNHEGIPRGRSIFTVLPVNEVPAGPVIDQVVVMPFQAEVKAGEVISFYVKLYDERGSEIQLQVQPVWTVDKGTIDSNGRYTAPAEPGEATVTATVCALAADQKVREVSGRTVVKIIPSAGILPRLSFFPAACSVSEGAYRDVWVEVSPVSGLQGCDFKLQFDPHVLRVAAVSPGVIKETVAQAIYDNEAGTVSFAAANGTPGDYPAGATLLTVTFAGITGGQSAITFGHHQLAGKDGVPLAHEASESILKVEPAGDVNGRLQLGPGVNLKKLALKFKALLAGQPVAVTLNEDGSFKVYGLPKGTHDLLFWCPGFLKKKVSLEVSEGETHLSTGPVELYAGDLNADNEVNLGDLVRLASSFWSSAGEARYLEIADFNRDEQIGLSDLIMMARSYRLKGDE
ncbi:MAG: hypothetical protein K6U04_15280, partial [Armatimonadetes bacterium]|nr:hypothetical protein [Armatimonadota bacterium]